MTTKMTVIRVSEESARKLRLYGKTYEDSVKALLTDRDNNKQTIDYDKIRNIVNSELATHSTKIQQSKADISPYGYKQ